MIMRGINHRTVVFMDCIVIFDCNCITCRSCFFTFAMSFLSPVRLAFRESSRHSLTSLLQALSCSLLVRSRLVNWVAKETAKDKSKINKVEYGIEARNSDTIARHLSSEEASKRWIHLGNAFLDQQLIILV